MIQSRGTDWLNLHGVGRLLSAQIAVKFFALGNIGMATQIQRIRLWGRIFCHLVIIRFLKLTFCRSEIVHVWKSGKVSGELPAHSAQIALDGVNYLTETVGKIGSQPLRAVTSWVADRAAPSYWKPNFDIIVSQIRRSFKETLRRILLNVSCRFDSRAHKFSSSPSSFYFGQPESLLLFSHLVTLRSSSFTHWRISIERLFFLATLFSSWQ